MRTLHYQQNNTRQQKGQHLSILGYRKNFSFYFQIRFPINKTRSNPGGAEFKLLDMEIFVKLYEAI